MHHSAIDKLRSKVDRLEKLNMSGNVYAQVEEQCRDMLGNDILKSDAVLECRVLILLSASLWQRGLAADALPYAEHAAAVASTLEDKKLHSLALGDLGSVYWSLSDYRKTLECYQEALEIAEAEGSASGLQIWTGNIGVVYIKFGDLPKALEYFHKALSIASENADDKGIVTWTGNIGNVYSSLNDYQNALTYFQRALALAERVGNKNLVALNAGNVGKTFMHLKQYPPALENLNRALVLSTELGSERGVAQINANIGELYYEMREFMNALDYLQRALEIFEKIDNKSGVAECLGRIGYVYSDANFAEYNFNTGEEYLLRAAGINNELSALTQNIAVYKALADLYERESRWDAVTYLKRFHEAKEQVQSEEARNKAEQLEFERRSAEHEKQLAIERTRAQEREHILNNILPEEITQRLVRGENPIADHFDCVSILFMDVVGFTPIASKMSAQQLVHLLNAVFTASDIVVREFGLEKIKTIGDAYMAVAGAPVTSSDHALRMALASIKLSDKIKTLVITFPPGLGDESILASLPDIEVRIGLHCGPAAAGVVGEDKFLYDLWGDTVNTAARMESHGEVGRIHITEEYVSELKAECDSVVTDESGNMVCTAGQSMFTIVPRGEVYIKGKGNMNTYFLEAL